MHRQIAALFHDSTPPSDDLRTPGTTDQPVTYAFGHPMTYEIAIQTPTCTITVQYSTLRYLHHTEPSTYIHDQSIITLGCH